MPKKLSFNLFLTTFIAVTLVTSGCSFRKDKVQKDAKAVSAPQESLLESFKNRNDEDIVSELESLELEDLYRQNALDIAIQEKKLKIITYLLASRNMSSFAYNANSKIILDQNPVLTALIEPYQNAQLMNILLEIKSENTKSKWNELFLRNRISSGSCVRLFQTISDWYYYRGINNTSDGILQITENRFLDYFNNITSTNTCKDLKSELSVPYLYSWLQNELKIQFHRNLQSSRVVELLKTLASFQNVAIEISTKSGILRIDPRLLILASSPNGESPNNKKYWIDLLSPMVSAQPIFYNVPFEGTVDKCDFDPICEDGNSVNVGIVLYWLGHPNVEASSEEAPLPEQPEELQ
ncbi:hypothetical protein DOM22_07585 [Bdellovibrio sp. ZAP7]|uniref:hypothetical protein n=1 Tax=Bdellovibrio sp. ZAP7 TaxID=2231053 RepID=UPI00115BB9C8|nr:hypothetical protein [Bdellovibrio sp. ZAP7]QDK45031.1 hypothetical protein DOM22_07585 [Bdellovibrio sp. ZAP7]